MKGVPPCARKRRWDVRYHQADSCHLRSFTNHTLTLKVAGSPRYDTKPRISEGLALGGFPSEEQPVFSSQVSPFPIIFLSLVILISDSSGHQGEARSAAQALFLFAAVPHPCPFYSADFLCSLSVS